jgi:hypothetical protein
MGWMSSLGNAGVLEHRQPLNFIYYTTLTQGCKQLNQFNIAQALNWIEE